MHLEEHLERPLSACLTLCISFIGITPWENYQRWDKQCCDPSSTLRWNKQGGGCKKNKAHSALLPLFPFLLLCLHLLFFCYLLSVSVSPSHGTPPAHLITSHSLLELQGTELCFISLLIFLRDWYLHTQIHTMLLCRAGGCEERGLYFPLELGHLMTNDNG